MCSPPTCRIPWRFWDLHGSRGFGVRVAGVAAPACTRHWACLTAVGPFLFTRFAIPEALLSFLLLYALWNFISGIESRRPIRIYGMWAALALATLTKGLIAPVFFAAAAIPLLMLSGLWRRWRELKPVTGVLLFLAIAAPWHILCGLANPDQGHPVGNHPTPGNVHGFWYFYFVNEHVLRFLGGRFPNDYNKMPFLVYWLAHLVWLFPWSLFLPALLLVAWRTRHTWMQHLRRDSGQTVDFYLDHAAREDVASYVARLKFRVRSTWLLALFSGFTLLFFAISTNQEYYTFPAWTPILMLIAGVLANIEERGGPEGQKPLLSQKWLSGAQAVFSIAGLLAAAALGWGLWQSRNLPFVSDIGTLLAHRDVGGYTLSTSHLFDLTGPSFAALRLPAIIAAVALLIGPALGWMLRVRQKHCTPPSASRSLPPFFLSPRTSPSRALSRCSVPSNSPTPSSARVPHPIRSSSMAISRMHPPSSFTPTTFFASRRSLSWSHAPRTATVHRWCGARAIPTRQRFS